MFVLPSGDAYDFVINLVRLTFMPLGQQLTPLQITYPLAVINAIISFGIIYLSLWRNDKWVTISAPAQLAAAFFGAANVFLFVFPLVPPLAGHQPYTSLPYWSHAIAGWAIFGIGFVYWLVWVHVLPRIGGYTPVESEADATERRTESTLLNRCTS